MLLRWVVLSLSILALSASATPISVVAPWTLEVGPIPPATTPVRIQVTPTERTRVSDEPHENLPVFDPNAGGWRKGPRLKALITVECSATGLLHADTLRIKSGPGNAEAFSSETDYAADTFWATFGRTGHSAIAPEATVYVDYEYTANRLDSIVVLRDGEIALLQGETGLALVYPPDLPEGARLLATVWLPGDTTELTDDNILPIDALPEMETPKPVADALLPKTMAKLRAGDAVTIVTWGDSVTNGGGVEGSAEDRYQSQFALRLRARFPKAEITLLNAAWGGANSAAYLAAPPEDEHNYQRDVLDPKPDLVTIEFVNDAGLSFDQTQTHYAAILDGLRANGSEVILITPHLVRPDWLGATSVKFDTDPREYVRGLRHFAAENGIALADASALWCRLWRQGIPYTTYLANSINHPDVRGHKLFADALMALFPQ